MSEQGDRHNTGKTRWTLADFDTLEGMVRVRSTEVLDRQLEERIKDYRDR